MLSSAWASGLRARRDQIESPSRSRFLFEHDRFGKPVSTFPDHALADHSAGACRLSQRARFAVPFGQSSSRLNFRMRNIRWCAPTGDRGEVSVRECIHDPFHELSHAGERAFRPGLCARVGFASQLPANAGDNSRISGALGIHEEQHCLSGTTARPSTTRCTTTGPPSGKWNAPGSRAMRRSRGPEVRFAGLSGAHFGFETDTPFLVKRCVRSPR
jgi:hypothetical protein